MSHSITEGESSLLRLLLKSSRSTTDYLGDQLGKSRNWITRMMKRLAEKHVIMAYVTVFDPAQVFSEKSTVLLIKTNPRELRLSKALLELPELESLDGISGEHSLHGLLRFRSPAGFDAFLNRIDRMLAISDSRTYKLVQVLATYKTRGFVIDKPQSKQPPLTTSELDLIRVIYRQSPSDEFPMPLSQEEIGHRMDPKLSQPAVSRIMKRLQERSTIVGYTVDISFGHVGLPVKFFLQIKTRPGTIAETARYVSRMDEVWDLHRTSEDFSLFATVRTENVDHYNRFLKNLYNNESVLDTQSQVSLEEWFVPVR